MISPARIRLGCVILLAAALSAVPSDAQTTAPSANRVTLFNGKDLGGWRLFLENNVTPDPKTIWSVNDGVLKFDTRTRGYIITEKSYSNYVMHVEWRWPKDGVRNGNSGVLIHKSGPDAIWPNSFEAQLQNQNAGQVVGMQMDIPAAPMLQNRKRAPRLTEPSEKPMGEWNTCDIHAMGNTIEVYVNGVKQNRVVDLPATEGTIALQMEGFPIEFRNVWLEPKP